MLFCVSFVEGLLAHCATETLWHHRGASRPWTQDNETFKIVNDQQHTELISILSVWSFQWVQLVIVPFAKATLFPALHLIENVSWQHM